MRTVAIYYDGASINPDCPVWKEVVYLPNDFDPANPVLPGARYSLLDDRGEPFPVARAFPLTAGSVFEVTGFVEEATSCGDLALEVIPQPELVFLHNANASDLDGDLIPDAIQNVLAGENVAPFADTDGDGYSDLQEILSGSDPTDLARFPMNNGAPASARDLSPPRVKVTQNDLGHFELSFDFPPDYLPYVEFELYSSDDLRHFEPTGLRAAPVGGRAGSHRSQKDAPEKKELPISQLLTEVRILE